MSEGRVTFGLIGLGGLTFFLFLCSHLDWKEWSHHPIHLRPKMKREETNNVFNEIESANDRNRIQNVCNSYGDRLRMPEKNYRSQFMVDSVHRVAYCRHGKVGTTTWMKHLIKLLPKKKQILKKYTEMSSHQLHAKLPKEFKASKGQKLDLSSYFVFSFVRHPFDRLVSAFKDKIVSGDDKGYRHVVVDIQRLFGQVTFENFLRYVIWDLQKYYQCQEGTNIQCLNHKVDVHWRPFYQRCAYCDVDYSFIGRMESFNRDVQITVTLANLTEYIPLTETNLQSHITRTSTSSLEEDGGYQTDWQGAIKASQRALDHFADVEPSICRQIHELYAPDFDLFHYSLEGFP